MRNLFMDHLGDGRSAICQCMLTYMGLARIGIHSSWSKEKLEYTATPTVSLWDNGRERGYFLRLKWNNEHLNVFFFEHRNSDNIIIKYFVGDLPDKDVYSHSDLPPDVYQNRFDYDISYEYNQPIEAVHYIIKLFEQFCDN